MTAKIRRASGPTFDDSASLPVDSTDNPPDARPPAAPLSPGWRAAEEHGGFPDWWHALISDLAPAVEQKSREYGTNSLAQMGRLLTRAQAADGLNSKKWPAADIEHGCLVYIYGKVERVLDAALVGRQASEDTWRDIMVYAAMALYARETGEWP